MASYFPKTPNFGILNALTLREYFIDTHLSKKDEDSRIHGLTKGAARVAIRYSSVAMPYMKYVTSLAYWPSFSNLFISGAMSWNLAMSHKKEMQKHYPKAARIRKIKAQAIKILPFIAMGALDVYLLKNMDIKTLDSIALLYTVIWTGADLCGKSKELNSVCSKSFKIIQNAYLSKMERLANKLFPPSQEEWEEADENYERRHLVEGPFGDDEDSDDYGSGAIGGGYESGRAASDPEGLAFSSGGDSESGSGAELPVFGRGFLYPADDSFRGESEDESEEEGMGSRWFNRASKAIGSLFSMPRASDGENEICMQDLGGADDSDSDTSSSRSSSGSGSGIFSGSEGDDDDERENISSPSRTNRRYALRGSTSPPNKYDPCSGKK